MIPALFLLATALADPVDYWRELAPRCAGHPSKDACDDGDMTLFGGLLCASGEAEGCDLVRDAQDWNGRWWRSPRRVGGNLGQGNSFSRDMSLGVLLYLVTTRDTDAAERWIAWIEAHRPCMVDRPGGGCLIYGAHRLCTDDADARCTITPTIWALMDRVFAELGLPPSPQMLFSRGNDHLAIVQQARLAPAGYEMHLAGVEVFLLEKLTDPVSFRAEAAAHLAEREPGNPFFAYLDGGRSPELQERVLEVCPSRTSGPPATRFQWAWERATTERAWEHSMGWDCVFAARVVGLAD